MEFVIQVDAREGSGRTKSRQLRRLGKVPAIVYGGGQAPSAVILDHNTLIHQMEHEAFYTSILTIQHGKDSQPVVIKDVHRHPAKPEILHVDFQRIVADVEISLHVPIHFVGEAKAKGMKDQGGVADHLLTDVEVTCLPKFLPEYLEVDVSGVELNQIVHLSDIKLPEGVELVPLQHGSDQAVFSISPPRREEPTDTEAPEAAAAPPTGQDDTETKSSD